MGLVRRRVLPWRRERVREEGGGAERCHVRQWVAGSLCASWHPRPTSGDEGAAGRLAGGERLAHSSAAALLLSSLLRHHNRVPPRRNAHGSHRHKTCSSLLLGLLAQCLFSSAGPRRSCTLPPCHPAALAPYRPGRPQALCLAPACHHPRPALLPSFLPSCPSPSLLSCPLPPGLAGRPVF